MGAEEVWATALCIAFLRGPLAAQAEEWALVSGACVPVGARRSHACMPASTGITVGWRVTVFVWCCWCWSGVEVERKALRWLAKRWEAAFPGHASLDALLTAAGAALLPV